MVDTRRIALLLRREVPVGEASGMRSRETTNESARVGLEGFVRENRVKR
jgi:hypothetical protein